MFWAGSDIVSNPLALKLVTLSCRFEAGTGGRVSDIPQALYEELSRSPSEERLQLEIGTRVGDHHPLRVLLHRRKVGIGAEIEYAPDLEVMS